MNAAGKASLAMLRIILHRAECGQWRCLRAGGERVQAFAPTAERAFQLAARLTGLDASGFALTHASESLVVYQAREEDDKGARIETAG